MSALDDDLRRKLIDVSNSFNKINEAVEGVVSTCEADLNKLEQARRHLCLSYSLCSMFWIQLQLNGQDTNEHPIHQEMTRLKRYIDRLKEIETSALRRTHSIDAPAAKRMIIQASSLDKNAKKSALNRNTVDAEKPGTSADENSSGSYAGVAGKTMTPSSVGISMNPFKKNKKRSAPST